MQYKPPVMRLVPAYACHNKHFLSTSIQLIWSLEWNKLLITPSYASFPTLSALTLCRSPVYATFTEALDGGASIRAYDAQHRFCQLNEQQVALSQQAAFAGVLHLHCRGFLPWKGAIRSWHLSLPCVPAMCPFHVTPPCVPAMCACHENLPSEPAM